MVGPFACCSISASFSDRPYFSTFARNLSYIPAKTHLPQVALYAFFSRFAICVLQVKTDRLLCPVSPADFMWLRDSTEGSGVGHSAHRGPLVGVILSARRLVLHAARVGVSLVGSREARVLVEAGFKSNLHFSSRPRHSSGVVQIRSGVVAAENLVIVVPSQCIRNDSIASRPHTAIASGPC